MWRLSAGVIEHRIQQIKRMPNVKVFLESRLTADEVLGFGFDRIIAATGSRWRRDGVARWHTSPVEDFKGSQILTPDDIMADIEIGGPVVIYDDDHYYMGPVLAERLKTAGLDVILVTPAGMVGEWSFNTQEQTRTQKRLLDLGVTILTGKAVSGFDGTSAEITCIYTGNTIEQSASSLIIVTARSPCDELYRQLISDQDALAENGINWVERIGDCRAPGTIAAAVYAGHRLAREVDVADPGDVSFRRERVTV